MRIWLASAMAGVLCLGAALPLHAQTVTGTWQTTLGDRKGVVKVVKQPDGRLHGEVYYLGTGRLNGNSISTIEVKGRHVHFELDEDDVTFDGELSADGDTLAGTSTMGGRPVSLTFQRATDKTAWVIDPSPHKVLFVPAEKDVQLEVLDWGGNGPPMIFLAGLGDTAHVFDAFAPQFTAKHHVYGVTRRGRGLSSKPYPTEDNYEADRLGDDVLAVIDALKLDRPVIVGHSMAGEELSSIGTRHPERVAGLIYLDATYGYAFYDPKAADRLLIDLSTLHRDMVQLLGATPSQAKTLIQEMQATIPDFQKELQADLDRQGRSQDAPPRARRTFHAIINEAMGTHMRKYTAIKGPVLAIVAVPHACSGNCDDPGYKTGEAAVATQTDAFEAGTPQARVVRIPHAEHYVFRSNEADVIREMNAFMDGLH